MKEKTRFCVLNFGLETPDEHPSRVASKSGKREALITIDVYEK